MFIFFIRYPGDGWGSCLVVSQSAELVFVWKRNGWHWQCAEMVPYFNKTTSIY